jgi:L-serine dehydratase
MRAGYTWISAIQQAGRLQDVAAVNVDLYGSLDLTGKGHGTNTAVILGLAGFAPETIEPDGIEPFLKKVRSRHRLPLAGVRMVPFDEDRDIRKLGMTRGLKHPNTLTLRALDSLGKTVHEETWLSIGGGFVVREADFPLSEEDLPHPEVPYPFDSAEELCRICHSNGKSISRVMLENEKALRDEKSLKAELMNIWGVMEACIERGCRMEGMLPGGLKVPRRAPRLYRKLRAQEQLHADPLHAMDWVDLFALAVNEENAAGGRVVTAPTNGASGIIPAVMAYYNKFVRTMDEDTVCRFLLAAAAIGSLYKKNASISGAEVGCQGEVGVACSMAAGGLAEIMGGTVLQVENAAEIGMEHNLGLTCDPVLGLVQVPCIERNAMGAVKAINACRIAMRGDGTHTVHLDKVIQTMFETGQDMQSKYKETAEGGLAVNIVNC